MGESTQPTQLEVWLQGFPRDEVEGRIADLERELKAARDALALHDSFAQRNGSAVHNSPDDPPENRPQAIRRVLREGGNQPMASGQIRAKMVENGWLGEDEQSQKRFYSALSTM